MVYTSCYRVLLEKIVYFLVPIILISIFAHGVFTGEFDMLMFLLDTSIFLVLYFALLAYCNFHGAMVMAAAYYLGRPYDFDIFNVLYTFTVYLVMLGLVYFFRRDLCRAAREV